jgi:hypothetical protein
MNRTFAAILMLSSVLFPTLASASTSASDAVVAQPIRISTGAIAPKLVDALNLDLTSILPPQFVPEDAQIDLSMTVDQNGKAHHVQVVKSFNPLWDACVVSAVEKAQFQPGTIDKQVIPMDVNLVVNVKR